MDIKKIPMTQRGYNKIQEELHNLKNIERPAIIQAVAAAREHGDLSENAEYHAAREKHAFIEGRITELEDKLGRADVIDTSSIEGDHIKFGATVLLQDQDTDEMHTYQIVGSDEADIKQGLLSITAPLARGLIQKMKGDQVEVSTPNGGKLYAVQDVFYR